MSVGGRRYEITGGGYRAELAEVGANLAGLWHGGTPGRWQPVTVDNPPDALPPKSSGAVLLPWPNRIAGGRYRFDGVDYQLPLTEPAQANATHGLARWVRWQAGERDASSLTLVHDLVPQTGYPFELRLQVTYSVGEDGLGVRVEAVNTGSTAAPFGAGCHPYLDLGSHDYDTAELLVPAAAVIETDERQIPTGSRPVEGGPYDFRTIRPIGSLRLDQGFAELTGSAALLRTERRTVELHWDAAFGYLQVFTPPGVLPGRNAVAIEPMSCPANAFNTGEGLVRLEPGERWSGNWGIRLV
jgi:aldose 1-epimerase